MPHLQPFEKIIKIKKNKGTVWGGREVAFMSMPQVWYLWTV